jgi:predicted dehydrogenase
MNQPTHAADFLKSRRSFLKQSTGALAAATLASVATHAHAAEDNTIKVALVGCGGRGTGAAINALSTSGPTQLVAMADIFPDRMESSAKSLQEKFGAKGTVPADRKFFGFDAFKKAVDALDKDSVVLLTTPPAFRPIHLEYAVKQGRNVFMEKSFAVDAPGIRRVLAAGKAAEPKNLKIAGGLMSRHSPSIEACVKQIHGGMIGEVVTVWSYRMHGGVGFGAKRPNETEVGHQIRNYNNFTWVNGSFVLDWLIHNLDVACWCKNGWPVSAQAMGGRQVRTLPDQLFDHYAVEYSFDDGTRMHAQGRHIDQCWGFWGVVVHGAKGCAVLGEGISSPKIYKGWQPKKENQIWQFDGDPGLSYQIEHDQLFQAIRENKPHNEAERCANSAMVGVLGRMACESGQQITWEQALASNVELAPGLENLTMDSPAPVMADAQGRYPIAMPGQTKVL